MINRIVKFQPYARLLTMLGDQLIKDEQIALAELIKNSYDADANWVKISFINFNPDYTNKRNSYIVIEDDGIGMTLDVIEKAWMRPATNYKNKISNQNEGKTKKGRVLQGEKGIGRFAVLKLGKKITITTRSEKDRKEYVVNYDFSKYDDDFQFEDNKNKEIFLEDLEISVHENSPAEIDNEIIKLGNTEQKRKAYGTKIKIEILKSDWSTQKVEQIKKQIASLTEDYLEILNPELKENKRKIDFQVLFYRDNTYDPLFEEIGKRELQDLINFYSVFKIKGAFDDKAKCYKFTINGNSQTVYLDNSKIKGLTVYKRKFINKEKIPNKQRTIEHNSLEERNIECGPFGFRFFIFDFSSKADSKYKLTSSQKKLITPHRVYLYRDCVRVYPYGDSADDWLQIDTLRGTVSAGSFLSNDQVIGYINISKNKNPLLTDKTNREGLIEQGNATSDFVALIQIFLEYIKAYPYQRYKYSIEKKTKIQNLKHKKVEENIEKLLDGVENDPKLKKVVQETRRLYLQEKSYLENRAEVTEDLAAVGLAVETSTHDIGIMIDRLYSTTENLLKSCMNSNINNENLVEDLTKIEGITRFIQGQLENLQILFRSAKRKPKRQNVKEVLLKIYTMFESELRKKKIEFEVNEKNNPLYAFCTDALLMQIFINLFDNSLYWLQTIAVKRKRILVTIDGLNSRLIFSDNGPGISPEDESFIFEPFYSGKGEDGRGLGLYISRQLLERIDYSIDLAKNKKECLLDGANFIIYFIKGD